MDHKSHRRLTKALLGDEFAFVHRFIDKPYAWRYPIVKAVDVGGTKIPVLTMQMLAGKHRMYRHDLMTAVMLGLKTKNPRVFMAAIAHLEQDHMLFKKKK